jgi:hypothetical protein
MRLDNLAQSWRHDGDTCADSGTGTTAEVETPERPSVKAPPRIRIFRVLVRSIAGGIIVYRWLDRIFLTRPVMESKSLAPDLILAKT